MDSLVTYYQGRKIYLRALPRKQAVYEYFVRLIEFHMGDLMSVRLIEFHMGDLMSVRLIEFHMGDLMSVWFGTPRKSYGHRRHARNVTYLKFVGKHLYGGLSPRFTYDISTPKW